MDADELRLRCLEAAAKTPHPHVDGYAAGVLETARAYFAWVEHPPQPRSTLTVPKKDK